MSENKNTNKIAKLTFISTRVTSARNPDGVEDTNSVIVYDGASFSAFISEWKPDATEADKKKKVKWTLVSPEGYIVDNTTQMTPPCAGEEDKNGHYQAVLPPKYGNTFRKACWELHVYLEDEVFGEHNFTGKIYPISKETVTKVSIFHSGRKMEDGEKIDFGTFLTLSIATTGLYGSQCIVSIVSVPDKKTFRWQKDEEIKTILEKTVKNEFGELVVWNIPTSGWFSKDIRRFQIRVQAINATLPDERGENKEDIFDIAMNPVIIEFSDIFDLDKGNTKMDESVTLITIKDSKLDISTEDDHCKFTKMDVKIGNREDYALFDENAVITGNTATRRYMSGNTTYYFAFDKDVLNPEAKETLNGLARTIIHKDLTAIIDGHADNRGSDEYNLMLGEKRAISVANYLIQQGVKERNLRLRSYGEYAPKVDNAKNAAEHQLNRTVNLDITLTGFVMPPAVYELVGNNKEYPEKMTVTIHDFTLKSCSQKQENKHDATLYIEHVTGSEAQKIKLDDAAEQVKQSKVHAPEFYFDGFSKLLDTMSTPKEKADWAGFYNQYRVGLNTCAYFPDKGNDVAEICVYPDSRILFHAMLDYTEPNYRLNDYFGIELTPGIELSKDALLELVKGSDFLTRVLQLPEIDSFVDILFDLVNEMSSGYQYGIHTLYNFTDRDMEKYAGLKDHTGDYKVFFIIVTVVAVLLALAIDILIIVLTEGQAAKGKLKKYAGKLKKFEDIIGGNPLSQSGFIDGSLGIDALKAFVGAEIYFNDQDPGNVVQNHRFKADLNPLIGVNCEFSFLASPSTNGNSSGTKGILSDKLKDWIMGKLMDGLKKAVGVQLSIKLEGNITAGIDVNVQYLVRQMMWKDSDQNKTGNIAQQELGGRISLKIEAEIDGVKVATSALGVGIPAAYPLIKRLQDKFFPKLKAEVIASFSGSVGLVMREKFDWKYKGPYIEVVAIVFPVFGKWDARFNVGGREDEGIDKNQGQDRPEETPQGDLIWNGDEYVLLRISLLDLLSGRLDEGQLPMETNKNKTR